MEQSAWAGISAAITAAPYLVEVLPPDPPRAAACLATLQITSRSWLGAVVYGTYGLIRGLGAVFVLLFMLKSKVDISDWLIGRYGAARVLAAGQLIFLGVSSSIVVGL